MDITLINTLFFICASLSCLAGAIAGVIRVRSSHVRPLHIFATTVLLFLFVVYGLAALARLEVIEPFSMLKNGILTSLGVFFLSNLFITMFIVGCKHYDR